mmetsp:Transcript_506/g.685  ORF Transcript_506/g.685 Transcript_506/m.685 type:complete len:127 (+) Transcript_506:102-482(+)
MNLEEQNDEDVVLDDKVRWIESDHVIADGNIKNDRQEESEEVDIPFDLFADPDPLDSFFFEWTKTNKGTIKIQLIGYKAELGQTLCSTGLTLWKGSRLLSDFITSQEDYVRSVGNILEVKACASVW